MDYEKAYKDALERARQFSEHPLCEDSSNIVEYIFPELKESEDERIRKELIKFIKKRSGCDYDYDKWIAWLEKQGEQKHIKNIVETWKEMRLEVYAQASGNRHEPNYSDDTTKMFSLNDIEEIIEKISEQKPIDKVEPKFKVGDWVVANGTRYKAKIYSIENSTVEFEDGTFETEESLLKDYHLWTIEDAKDGDVVVDKSDGAIGIFRSIEHHSDGGSYNYPSYCFLHCRYDEGYFYVDFEHGNTIDSDNLIPATKEQRNLLFQKIKETGYIFDFEKKELKKIEQAPTWSEEDENQCINTIELVKNANDCAGILDKETALNWLKSLKERVYLNANN